MAGDPLVVRVGYPWQGLPEKSRGAARRVVTQCEFLADHGVDVAVLSPGCAEACERRGVAYRFLSDGSLAGGVLALAFRVFDGLGYHLICRQSSARERRQLWHYLHPRFQSSLRRAFDECLGSCDVLVLEYPFWASVAVPVARRRGIPVVITFHDILSDTVASPWLRERVEACERAACRLADALVCVSPADRARLATWGFDAEMIPHGFDLKQAAVVEEPWRVGFRRIEAARGRGAMVCLFVGSSLEPNRVAVARVKAMAALGREDIFFVIAGGCAGEEDVGGNLISLGVVSENELGRLYELSDVVLAPLESGSGSSTKVLEALGRRKALVSTSIGARGYDMVSGRDCLIVDGMEAFAGVLDELSRWPARREELAMGGWNFVQAFDRHRVCRRYLSLLERVAGCS